MPAETSAETNYDLIVVGAGPGGYHCALHAAAGGMRVACVERWPGGGEGEGGGPAVGGTCLLAGCIPSKALLESSWRYRQASLGLVPGMQAQVRLDLPGLMRHKDAVVERLRKGVDQLLTKAGVEVVYGQARLAAPGEVLVAPATGDMAAERVAGEAQAAGKTAAEQVVGEMPEAGGKVRLRAGQVVLAAGSSPMDISGLAVDHERVLDSTDALSLAAVPKRMAVIGAGAVGLELASVWARYGAQVTVLEALDGILAPLDPDLTRLLVRSLKAQGVEVRTGAKVGGCEQAGGGGVRLSISQEGGEETLEFDQVLVAAGRRPNTDGLLDPGCGVRLDARGFVEVDRHCKTHAQGVWAIGDLVRGPMLAHKAIAEARMVADRVAGEETEVNLDWIPAVVYTHPEAAWVGLGERAAAAKGLECTAEKAYFAANGRALGAGEAEGAVKAVADEGGRVLGVQAVGPMAGEIVQQALIGMEFGAAAADLESICFAHPGNSEVLHEAASRLADKLARADTAR